MSEPKLVATAYCGITELTTGWRLPCSRRVRVSLIRLSCAACSSSSIAQVPGSICLYLFVPLGASRTRQTEDGDDIAVAMVLRPQTPSV